MLVNFLGFQFNFLIIHWQFYSPYVWIIVFVNFILAYLQGAKLLYSSQLLFMMSKRCFKEQSSLFSPQLDCLHFKHLSIHIPHFDFEIVEALRAQFSLWKARHDLELIELFFLVLKDLIFDSKATPWCYLVNFKG
jgi:hypothetical protein